MAGTLKGISEYMEIKMNNRFPFTDYDFYAYLTAGMIVLFSLDFGISGGAIAFKDNWPFVHVVFAVAVAYIVGQITAGIASIVLEHWIARRVLRPPVAVMMGLGAQRIRERLIGRWIVGRYYEPLPKNIRLLIIRGVSRTLGKQPEQITDPEEVFQVAFPEARKMENAARRMDEFRKMYGFSRNIALAGLVGTGAVVYRGATIERGDLYWWGFVVFIVSVMMFGRFLKFYAAYGAEVLRTYASLSGGEKRES